MRKSQAGRDTRWNWCFFIVMLLFGTLESSWKWIGNVERLHALGDTEACRTSCRWADTAVVNEGDKGPSKGSSKVMGRLCSPGEGLVKVKSLGLKPEEAGWGFEVFFSYAHGREEALVQELYTRCCRGSTSRGSSAQILVDSLHWRNTKLCHCFGEDHFCFYKLGCAVLLFPASFLLLLLAVIYCKYNSTCKSLHNIPAPEIMHCMLLAIPGHTSCSLCLWFFYSWGARTPLPAVGQLIPVNGAILTGHWVS